MLLKYGVNPTISHVITKHFDVIDKIFKKYTKREAIITSANDGRHSNMSIHYRIKKSSGACMKEAGAIDLRIWYIQEKHMQTVLKELKKSLGKDYDIVLEATHIHCEYDPK